MRKYRPFLIAANLVIFSIVGVDVLLHIFDVWGAHTYFDDLHILFNAFEDDEQRGHRIAPGIHTFTNWSATVLPDGTRLVPQTVTGDCLLATLGDSVTFGHGVNDGDTFTAQLARDFPAVRWVNGGIEGYNAEQVRLTRDLIAADGYVYLLIENDADARVDPYYVEKPLYRASLPLYWQMWQTGKSSLFTGLPEDLAMFDAAVAELQTDARVVVVGIAGDPLADHARVPVIPRWTHDNSFIDAHPNAAGHRQIANALHDAVQTLIEQRCKE
jgi:hypothetical protein